MNNFVLAYRSLFKKGQNNLIKILSLGTGLAVGLVIISKVFFDNSYESFFPDNDRIYMIESNVVRNDEPPTAWGQVSGAIAPGMKEDVPGVEEATRYTYIGRETPFYTKNKDSYKGTFILADRFLFDIFPLSVTGGDPKDILTKPMYALISESLAEKMGGEVIGQTIQMDSYPGKDITIGGIFKDIPENSHLDYSVIISMVSVGNFTWSESPQNWLGNDRYKGYVKLASGVKPEELAPAVYQMQIKHQDITKIEETGLKLSYSFIPLTEIHSGTPEIKRMTILLSAIAFALIFTALMNYILLVITTLVGRAKTIAVNKCYGAGEIDITKQVFTETAIHLFISLTVSAVLIILFKETIREILAASVYSLFSFRTCFFLLVVCLFILLVAGFVPSYIFSRIPVASVFRGLSGSRLGWKMALLFVQLAATAFLVNLLLIVSRQYDFMLNDNPGYVYENVLYCSVGGVSGQDKLKIVNELQRLSEVEMVASATALPFSGLSGNNVYLLNAPDNELFNIADFYWCNENFLPLMEIPIIDGNNFNRKTSTGMDVLVSRKFADKILEFTDWKDGVVGKEIHITEHSDSIPNRIVGVYENIRLGSISIEDKRPSVMFYSDTPTRYILVKMHELGSGNIEKVYNVFKSALPDKDITIIPYANSMVRLYEKPKMFSNAITIGGIVTLIITLVGLIGYTINEVNRRKFEIAVRRVNGAALFDILKLFIKNNLWITIPALICGGIVASVASIKWMEDFSEKIELSPWLFISCGTVVLMIVLLVVIINCMKVANRNPVEALKKE